MEPRNIIINLDGLTAKVKNPHTYSESMHSEWFKHDASNPSYPLTEPGEPGKECKGVLVKQLNMQEYLGSDRKVNSLEGLFSAKMIFKDNWVNLNEEQYAVFETLQGEPLFAKLRKAWQVVSNKEETPATSGTFELSKIISDDDWTKPTDSCTEAKEQSIEKAANNYYNENKFKSDQCLQDSFIAGANHILSSKVLVDREEVVGILKESWCNCKCDNCSTNNLLTDLINKIKEIHN